MPKKKLLKTIIIIIFFKSFTKSLFTFSQQPKPQICKFLTPFQNKKKCCENSNPEICCSCPSNLCCSKKCCNKKYPICDVSQNQCWENNCVKKIDTSNLIKGYSLCNYYKTNNWLPPDYLNAAYCACRGKDKISWLSPSNTCLRNFLFNGHKNFSDDFKKESKYYVDNYYPNFNKGDRRIYFNWLENNLREKVFILHKDGFEACGCPRKVALEYFWGYILKYGTILSKLDCNILLGFSRLTNTCGCQGW